jgi:hypothetical protein
MIRPSFVPPPPIRRLRDLTRYRADLVVARTAEKNRVEKLLEDAQIKLSVVVSDIFGVSGREMLAALVAGERGPKVLAQLARRSMRKKIIVLEEAFTGHFTGHHAFLLAQMPGRVDAIAALDARIEEQIASRKASPTAGHCAPHPAGRYSRRGHHRCGSVCTATGPARWTLSWLAVAGSAEPPRQSCWPASPRAGPPPSAPGRIPCSPSCCRRRWAASLPTWRSAAATGSCGQTTASGRQAQPPS